MVSSPPLIGSPPLMGSPPFVGPPPFEALAKKIAGKIGVNLTTFIIFINNDSNDMVVTRLFVSLTDIITLVEAQYFYVREKPAK